MPKETANFKLPYPESTDANDVPADLKKLAEKLDSELGDIAPSQITATEADDGELIVVKDGVPTLTPVTGDVTITEGGVTAIGAGKVDTPELADQSVTTAKINDGDVTAVKLASDAVETAKIKDGSVTRAKMKGVLAHAGNLSAEVNAGTTKDFAITWEPSGFASTNYIPVASLTALEDDLAGVYCWVRNISETKVTVRVVNTTASKKSFWIFAIGILV